MPTLLDPLTAGALRLRNRVVMAPMTRGRATRDHVPTALMRTYYAQRASAGLIISEGIGISREGLGWPFAPGLWTAAQVEAWKPIVAAVHEAGGLIAAQLWHMGRLVHSSYRGGAMPVAPSPIRAEGQARIYDEAGHAPTAASLAEGNARYDEPRALAVAEIPRLLEDFRRAAANALAAGFDGVQIHAANGYLIDQFLRDAANRRDDDYGGSIPHRVRLLREVTEAVMQVAGAGRTGVRLSPNGPVLGIDDSAPHALFEVVAETLSQLGVAFVELREPRFDTVYGTATVPPVHPVIRAAFRGVLMLNTEYDLSLGNEMLDAGVADAISFGRSFIANPDLPERFAAGRSLAKEDPADWYARGSRGYTDMAAE